MGEGPLARTWPDRPVRADFATRDASPLVPFVADAMGVEWRIGRRLAGGTWGAWLVRSADGSRAVLKCVWEIDWRPRVAMAAEIVRALHERGLPVPLIRGWGYVPETGTWVLSDYLPGRAVTQLDRGILPGALTFVEGMAGAATGLDVAYSWSGDVARTLGDDSQQLPVLDAAGGEAAALGGVARAHAAGARGLLNDDAVHGDLLVTQLLAQRSGGRLAGVIDWEQAGRGSRAIDLALLFQNVHVQADRTGVQPEPEVVEAIATAGVRAGGHGFSAAVHAHLVKMVAFVLANNPPHVAWRLDVASRVGASLARLGLA